MKILWMSDSPVSPSGFGNVTRFVCAYLADQGHRVSILGWQARGRPVPWRNCTLYPVRHSGFGADVLLGYLRRVRPEVLVTLADVWWLTYITHPMIANFMRTAGIPWVLYYPIDADNGNGQLPPSWVRTLKAVDLPVAMSQYGRDLTQANGVNPAYIPHGVDIDIFQPPEDKAEAKRAAECEGRFVVLSDARNQPRKLLPRTLEIFRRFAAGKDDVLLHLHCDPEDPASRAPGYHYDVRRDVEHLGVEDKVRFTADMSISTGISLERLAGIYRAADVHLLSSWGEGFGLPTLQAAAAGVVPLASDYTASRELVLGHGEAIRVRHFVDDQFGLRRALIDVDDAVGRLERLYQDRELLASKSRAARGFAEAYDWGRIVPQWHDLLRREVPHLRNNLRYPTATSRIMISPRPARHPSSDTAGAVRGALPTLPYGAQATVSVVESRAGELTADILRDAFGSGEAITIPVTLPPADPSTAASRVTGRVYLASPSDAPAFGILKDIFPGLSAWSSVTLDPEPDETPLVETVAADVPEYRRHLAASTLALDIAGADAGLPTQAAAAGVPCIGPIQRSGQARLWPDLSLTSPDPVAAAALGRWVLTDQGDAAETCARARSLLVALRITPVAGGI